MTQIQNALIHLNMARAQRDSYKEELRQANEIIASADAEIFKLNAIIAGMKKES